MTSLVVCLWLAAGLPPALPAEPGVRVEDAQRREPLPTPDSPGDIPTPPGYAPRDPQPFLGFPQVALAQYVAVLGVGGVMGWVSWVPVLGLLTQLVTPGAQALSAVYAGDRLGSWRSPLLWPVVTAYAVSWLGTGAAMGLQVAGQVLLLGGMMVGTVAMALGGPVGTAFIFGGLGAGAVGLVLVAAGTVGTLLVQYVAVPGGIVAAYHLARVEKRQDDNGDGFPRVLPGRGLPLPFFGPGRGEEESRDEERETTPVRAPTAVTP